MRQVLPENDEAIGIGVGERFEEDCVTDAEDRCIGSNAQCQCHDRCCGEAGVLAEVAPGIDKIGDEGLDCGDGL
jgi:hypothetical protein